jgi:uncharacterized protein YabE (DUF348 family)
LEWYTFKFENRAAEKKRRLAAKRRRLVILALLVSLFLVAGAALSWSAWARMDVTVADDGRLLRVTAFRGTVADLLEREGITIGPWDRVYPAPETPLHDGIEITVDRAVPVTVRVDGRDLEVWTVAQRVGQVLADAGVELNAGDLVQPAPETPVTARLEIGVVRVTTEVEEVEIATPYQVERRPAYDLPKGQTRVLVQGENGLIRETWRITYHDGTEVDRELVKREEVLRPRNQVLLVGMADIVTRGVQDIRFERMLTAEATAYTYTGNNTATGVPPGPGTVAVDPQVIPLGSRLYIDGYGYGKALDVGGKIKGKRIDVFFPTRQEALQWGRRTVNVYVLK